MPPLCLYNKLGTLGISRRVMRSLLFRYGLDDAPHALEAVRSRSIIHDTVDGPLVLVEPDQLLELVAENVPVAAARAGVDNRGVLDDAFHIIVVKAVAQHLF